MNTATIRQTGAGRVRRFARRRAGWILVLFALASVFIYRHSAVHGTEIEAPTITFTRFPPAALLPVHVKSGNVSLREFFDDLSRQAHIPFTVEYNSLAVTGITAESKFTIDFDKDEQVPLWRAMEIVRRAVSHATGADIEADFTANPVFVAVSDFDDSPNRQITVIYPIGDLLELKCPWVYRSAPENRIQSLCGLIRAIIEPEKWQQNGGQCGNIAIRDNTLVISATPTMQFEVRQLLDALRHHRG